MGNERDGSLESVLQVYRLPEDASSQQPLIERAEEDLLCAVSLYRRGACGYLPLVTACFLAHQALEKWLKAFIAVCGLSVSAKGQHNLYDRFMVVEKKVPEFKVIREKVEAVEPEILDHKFPGNLRYNETPANVERYVEVLMEAAFLVRKLVKRQLNKSLEEGSYESSCF
ncbi:MAG: HEPN domain-containing protein [Anaerolineae bacterium]|nr:HEPN domain-containing protein [Anaerolineae bacterium]